jgi:hypothetical protein
VFRVRRKLDEWPQELLDRYWLIWRGILRRAQRFQEGAIDHVEIERLFGPAGP